MVKEKIQDVILH